MKTISPTMWVLSAIFFVDNNTFFFCRFGCQYQGRSSELRLTWYFVDPPRPLLSSLTFLKPAFDSCRASSSSDDDPDPRALSTCGLILAIRSAMPVTLAASATGCRLSQCSQSRQTRGPAPGLFCGM
jgi:hypothetical protein